MLNPALLIPVKTIPAIPPLGQESRRRLALCLTVDWHSVGVVDGPLFPNILLTGNERQPREHSLRRWRVAYGGDQEALVRGAEVEAPVEAIREVAFFFKADE